MHVYNLGCTVLDFVHAQLRGVLEHPEHPPKYAPDYCGLADSALWLLVSEYLGHTKLISCCLDGWTTKPRR